MIKCYVDMNNKLVKTETGQIVATKDLTALTKTLFNGLDINQTSRVDYETRTPMFLDFIKRDGLNRNSYLEYKRYLASRVDFSVATKAKYLTAVSYTHLTLPTSDLV